MTVRLAATRPLAPDRSVLPTSAGLGPTPEPADLAREAKEWIMPADAALDPIRLQRYRDYSRQRQMTLGDLLLENRIIFLEGVINDAVANLTVMKFLYLQYENRTQGISFYINSPGGSVSSTLAIYDTMQFIDCPVATYCIGLAASGAAVLLAGGSKGRRFSLPHSKIMIHQPYGAVGGQVSDIEIQAEEIIKSREMINEILAKHTKQPIEQIAKDTERDRYLTALQAKEYGLVDEVVGHMPGSEAARQASPAP
jgi:ATP-dependent Clp protease, protease subunit